MAPRNPSRFEAEAGGAAGPATRRRPRETFAERRARRGEIDDPEVVFAAAARFLEARSRSVGEVRRRLSQAGYRAELVEGAIARLAAIGILDDETFAREWVASRDRARPRGENALRRELALRGVERELVETVLDARRRGDRVVRLGEAIPDGPGDDDGLGGESADEAAALRLLERRAASLRRERDPRVRRQKAYALLARNGFDPGVCGSVASRWTSADDATERDAEAAIDP